MFARIAAISLLLVSGAAMSQDQSIVPLIENGKSIYMPGQFARFAPQTAADIVAQIPGFSVTQVSNDRGLGEASQNVLINGQRITGKGNDAMTVLRRISVTSVISLEIVDAATLDISGLSGDVLNVITEQGGIEGNFAWRPVFREQVGTFWAGSEVNVSGKSGFGDFSLGFRVDGFRGGGWGGATEYWPATDVSFWRDQKSWFGQDIPKLSGTLSRTNDSGSIWNLIRSMEARSPMRRFPSFRSVMINVPRPFRTPA